MKPNEIQDLIDFIAKSGLDEVNIKTESFTLSAKKHSPAAQMVAPVPQNIQYMPQPQMQQAVAAAAPAAVAAPVADVPAVATSSAKTKIIKSSMLGTFYRSPSPDQAFFVNVGDDIRVGQRICIIEAMKLFNEIESEIEGRIVKVLVENSTPVEYDQPLFEVEVK